MKRVSGSPDAGVRVELYVRSLSPRGSRQQIVTVVEQLNRLVESGVLRGYRVVPTGRELPATPADAVTDWGEFLQHRLAVFEEWANRSGRSLGSAIERRAVFSQFTGQEHDALVMPTMLMAEYEGTTLRFVAPCEGNDERVDVRERLDALASREKEGTNDRLADAGVRSPPGPTTPVE